MSNKVEGTWIPEDVFTSWESLRLTPPAWNVLMVVAQRQYRYGGREARITLDNIARRTKHSLSTVKRAIRKLRDEALLVRLGRGRLKLVEVNMTTPFKHPKKKREKVSVTTPLKGHDPGPFSILLLSIIKENKNSDAANPFTPRQLQALDSVLCQISELLGSDALEMTLPGSEGVPKTYKYWLRTIVDTQDRDEARLFVRAILKLLKDERVAGRELK